MLTKTGTQRSASRDWTAAEDATIRRMAVAGHKIREIADALGVSYTQAKDRRRKLCGALDGREPAPRFDHARALRLHAEGATDGEIAEAVGRHKTTVAAWLRAQGKPSNRPPLTAGTKAPRGPRTTPAEESAAAPSEPNEAQRIARYLRDYQTVERMARRGELTPLQRRELLEQARDLCGISSLRVKNGDTPIGTGRMRDSYPRYGS